MSRATAPLAFPRTAFPQAADPAEPDRDRLVGHGLRALWQTPWMAPVCVRGAADTRYECRVALELEAGHRVELTRDALRELSDEDRSADGWERIRPEEHRFDPEGPPLDQTVIAVAVDEDRHVFLVTEGGLLSVDERLGGPLRFEALYPDTRGPGTRGPDTRGRLEMLRDYWTDAPLLNMPGR